MHKNFVDMCCVSVVGSEHSGSPQKHRGTET